MIFWKHPYLKINETPGDRFKPGIPPVGELGEQAQQKMWPLEWTKIGGLLRWAQILGLLLATMHGRKFGKIHLYLVLAPYMRCFVWVGPGQGVNVEGFGGTSESHELWVVINLYLTTMKGPKSHSWRWIWGGQILWIASNIILTL